MHKDLESYFYNNQIFSYEGIREAFPKYRGKEGLLKNLLQYHLKKRHLARIKKALYSVIPAGSEKPHIDPFVVASQLASDAVIGYQSALDFYGYLHSTRFEVIFLTHKNISKGTLQFGEWTFKRSKVPEVLIQKKQTNFEIQEHMRFGKAIHVVSPERAFVDVLDRPSLFGSDWEEISQTLRKVHLGRPSAMVDYLRLLGSSTTASRVGYFIEKRPDLYNISEKIIEEIYGLRAKNVTYLDRNRIIGNVLIHKWNLMVPAFLHHSLWEEKNDYI